MCNDTYNFKLLSGLGSPRQTLAPQRTPFRLLTGLDWKLSMTASIILKARENGRWSENFVLSADPKKLLPHKQNLDSNNLINKFDNYNV
ncbi:hypothetical protein TNCV_4868341 [Trichonephila clavipes]|nr:hypothetical protein TNCV_4868341 [Trichonephila clavipes]